MKEIFGNTYCNPIVLPDYPLLPALNERSLPVDSWNREGKKLLNEFDILSMEKRFFGEKDVRRLYQNVRSPKYGRVVENDVRATADPTVCYWDGRWYLYTTSGMMYDSDDLVHWKAHVDETWMPISAPMAPTVERFHGKYYATSNSTPLHVSESPLGPWEMVGEWTLPDGREMLCNDPMIFADGDRLYLYWGLGVAIFGAELDPSLPNHLLTDPKVLIRFNPQNRWERFGASNEDWEKGFIEGSWMKKVGTRYYLIYSCSGTEYYNYAMGAYFSDSPLGDFILQPLNPVSRSRNGLVRGGGHGSIVDGPLGTMWIFYTIPVCIDAIMERRIGMDPVGIDKDGNIYAKTGSETPQFSPGILDHPEEANDAGLVPLTICKPTLASSYAPGHLPFYAVDETLHTWWQPAEDDKNPCFSVLLQGMYCISAARILWKDVGLNFEKGIFPGAYQYILEYSNTLDNEDWKILLDESQNTTDLAVDYREFQPVQALRVRIRILGSPKGVTPGLLDFTIFGISASCPDIS